MPVNRTCLGALALAFLLTPTPALTGVRLPGKDAPIPEFRPETASSPAETKPATAELTTSPVLQYADGLKSGLDAIEQGDVEAARRALAILSPGSLDHQIISWALALSGQKGITSKEIDDARHELADWPGMATLQRNLERALFAENAPPQNVVEAIGGRKPTTYEGVIVLARAHVALGDTPAARAVLGSFWRNARLEAKEEAIILREFAGVISAADHHARMEQMLHYDRVNSALRVGKLAGAEQLAVAWGAVIRRERNAGKLLGAVPKSQRDAGYVFAKARYLRWAKKYRAAADLMLGARFDAASLVDPDAWWVERRVLSRELLDADDAVTAYRLAAAHSAESPEMAADAEFHAGWYALRGMKSPATAARHFAKIAEIAQGPISLARAYYWLGRAADAGGPGDARSYYEQAAEYGAAFYGQLAAARIGRTAVSTNYPLPSAADRTRFAGRAAVRAIRRLEETGHPELAGSLYRDLARELKSVGELALLAVMAEKRGDHYLALRIGKIAAARGLDVGGLAHPIGVIPASAKVSSAGKALAYAIARQESEFNISAVSPAGARGLLQLLPQTARHLAKRAGMHFSAERLTTDAAYNATLGAAYLNDQLGRFNGSYVLTFVGYNAGPARANEWVDRYGDPRGKDIDTVIDWIERIPYTETRNYVERVMENFQIYKMRLSGRIDIVADLRRGR